MLPEKVYIDNEAPKSAREQLLRDIMKLPKDDRDELLAPYFEKCGGAQPHAD